MLLPVLIGLGVGAAVSPTIRQGINSVTDLLGIRLFPGGTLSDQAARASRDAAKAAVTALVQAGAQIGVAADKLNAEALAERLSNLLLNPDTLTPADQELISSSLATMNAAMRQAASMAYAGAGARGLGPGAASMAAARVQAEAAPSMGLAAANIRQTTRQQTLGNLSAGLQAYTGMKQTAGNLFGQAAALHSGIAQQEQARADAAQARFMSALVALGGAGVLGPDVKEAVDRIFGPGAATGAAKTTGGTTAGGVPAEPPAQKSGLGVQNLFAPPGGFPLWDYLTRPQPYLPPPFVGDYKVTLGPTNPNMLFGGMNQYWNKDWRSQR